MVLVSTVFHVVMILFDLLFFDEVSCAKIEIFLIFARGREDF